MSKIVKCPECGSKKAQRAGKLVLRRGKVQKYRCVECGRNWTVGITVGREGVRGKPQAPPRGVPIAKFVEGE